jgi:hypothetical protein
MKRYVGGGIKDEKGIFLPPARKASEDSTLALNISDPTSLDEINEIIVLALARAVKKLAEKVVANDVSREVVGALKDCESMHRELAKKEKELLAGLSDEDLEKLAEASFKMTHDPA